MPFPPHGGHVQEMGGAPGKAMFGPGSGSEVGWRCGGSGWGVQRVGGVGTRSTAEAEVCGALTGVAEGAVPDDGELQGAGSPWVWWGKGRDWPGRLKGWGPDGEDLGGSEEGSRGGMGPGSLAFPLRGLCPTPGFAVRGLHLLRCLPPALPRAESRSDRCHRASPWEGGVSLVRSGEALKTRNLGEVFHPATY